MSDHHRPRRGPTPDQRKPKRSKKPAQAGASKDFKQDHKADTAAAAPELVETTMTPVEAAVSALLAEPAEPAAVDAAAVEPEVAPASMPVAAPPSAGSPPVGLQTIASAYRDYTRKSLAEATSFVEKLAAARSLDKAVEAQTEFARQACATFATDSRKIRTLYQELFWQSLKLPNWPPGQAQR